MIQGMTGFAEKSFVSGSLRLKISVKTLNHRFFDWSFKGAPIGEAENRLRTLCQRKIRRGRVEVFVEMISSSPSSWNFRINEGLLERILASLDRVSRKTGRRLEISLDSIFRVPQLVELSRKGLDEKEVRFLERSFDRTLDSVVRLRQREGRATARQIMNHIANIRRATARIEARFKKQPALLQARLKQRLRDLNHNASLSEERLAEETSFLAQRYDLGEEVARLKAHLSSLQGLVASRGTEPAGKKLDFLAQELHREANTLNSKSQDIRITKDSLAIKNELETIRQHIQNIE
jgi:uncharacterized protein (TIGR00255 family)